MYTISIQNNKAFSCGKNETILAAAKNAGITLDHSCLLGRCSSCKVKVEIGSSVSESVELSLSEEEKQQGFILSCIRTPLSDMKILAEDLSEYDIPNSKTLPAKIKKLEKLGRDVLKVELRTPPNQSFQYLPGQYINVIKGDIKRSYSLANSNLKMGNIELFVKNYAGGKLSEYWFNKAKVNDLLRLEGPKGTFFLRNLDGVKNIIFLATGTGIAPIKSMLESLPPEVYSGRKFYLFWGVKTYEDLFWTPEFLPFSINYIPVLSRENHPLTKRGYVQDVVLIENVPLSNSSVYACGSDQMIFDAKNKLVSKGLPDNNFYSDAFVSSN